MTQPTPDGTGFSRRRSLFAAGAFALGASLTDLPAKGRAKVVERSVQTPTPTGAELAPGVFAEVFIGAPSDRAPDQTVYLVRFTFMPDGEIFPHGHPGSTILSVVSGSFGWTLVEGTAHVIRAAASGETGPVEDIIEVGAEVTLEPGDAIFYEDDVIHTARGAGSDEPAIVHGTLVLTAGAPLIMPMEEHTQH